MIAPCRIAPFFCAVALALLPSALYAQGVPDGGLSLDTCAPALQSWQITGRVVYCIQSTVIAAVTEFVNMLTLQLRFPVGVLVCVAILFFSFKILGNERGWQKQAPAFALRVALVVTFAFNLAYAVNLPFLLVEQALRIGTGGWSPWVQIDMALSQLIGFGPNFALSQGVLGILGAAIFSGGSGFLIFVIGFLVILEVLGLILRAVYTYLASMTLIGLLMALSPLLVPLAIMGYTERYFRKWADLLIAAMLQPLLLFSFLWVFLALVDIYVGAIFNVLGGNDFTQLWRYNQSFFSWAMVTDPGLLQQYEAAGLKKSAPLVNNFMGPMLGRAMDFSVMTHPGIHFGANGMAVMQQFILALLAMGITLYLLRSLLEVIPRLSDQLAGVTSSIGFERVPLLETAKKALQTAASKGGNG